ncbi:MAG: MATE family efflux transporter [Bacteroidales bacterium]|nr:MATE family efflux transporter [Bacteroidales bacterium]
MLLCGPAIVAQLASVLLQFIDASMVGSLGANPSASIGLIATTTWLFGGFLFAACQGFSVQVAHLIGANDFKAARQVLRESLTSCIGLSLTLALIGVAISPFLPHWLGGSEDIAADASSYFFIYSLSLPFMQITWLGGTMLQCSGNMKLPSILDVVMCLMDVIFNFFLIFPTREVTVLGMDITMPGAGLGVTGAALGTGLAMAITAGIMMWCVLVRSPQLNLRQDRGSFRPSAKCLKNALGISGPMWLQNVAMRGAHIAGTIIVAPLGAVAIAANNFAITAEALCYMPGFGMADAATTLVGQSLGAAREKLARSFSRITLLSGMAMMTILAAVMFLFAPQIMSILSNDASVIELGAQVLRIEAFAETLYAASIVAYGSCVGAGDTMIPSILNFTTMWIVRIGLALILTPKMGLLGYWIPMCIELNIRGILFLLRIRGRGWMKKALVGGLQIK